MNELDYIKYKFLKNVNPLCIFKGDSEANRSANAFQYQFNIYINKIKEAKSTLEVKEYINQSREIFLDQWAVAIQENSINPSTAKKYLEKIYFTYNLNNPDEWFKQTTDIFQQKKHTKFFEKITNALLLFKTNLTTSNTNFDREKITEYSLELIDKYNLASIDLSGIQPSKAMTFLKKLNKNAQQVCDKLGIPTYALGINGTISFASEKNIVAFFQPADNTIHIGKMMNNSNTILHEWIHSLDYHIGNKIQPRQFATTIESSVVIDQSDPNYQAFKHMKQLSQEIFSDQPQLVQALKQRLIQEGTAKFWNDLIGEESYLLPNNIRDQLQSQESFILINNFLSNPDNDKHKYNLINFIKSNGISNEKNLDFILNPNINSPIFKNKTYFDDVNKNLFSIKSNYYITSNLANYINNGFYFIPKKIQEILNPHLKPSGNVNDPDYFTQPVEMMSRYFESQIFNGKTNIINLLNCISGMVCYKIQKDDSFEVNKNNILSAVFGSQIILNRVIKIREQSNSNNMNSINSINNMAP